MSIEAMKQALEYIKETNKSSSFWMVPASELNKTVNALRQAIEQAEKQKPITYDKTKMNCFVQELYDRKMQEGKRGHYETMFHCVHQAIKRLYTTPQPKHEWVGLTPDDFRQLEKENTVCGLQGDYCPTWDLIEATEAKLKEKNHVN